MRTVLVFFVVALIASAPSCKIKPPEKGTFYWAAFPGTTIPAGEEDEVTVDDVASIEEASGKKLSWVYFSNSWYTGKSRAFPAGFANECLLRNSVPYIRLMLWSQFRQNEPDPAYSLQSIVDGKFDADLKKWAKGASSFSAPVIAEYGVEVNGDWFPWNGVYAGGGETDGYGDPAQPDGPERFRDAYRHIIRICREEGATNIIWVFHVNNSDWPNEDWNRFENYYPGDGWIDWIGVSVYGAQTPMSDNTQSFADMMDEVYPRLSELAKEKPIMICEFACTDNHPLVNQALWAEEAIESLASSRWPKVAGFSWWNDHWENDDDPSHNTNMRIQDNPELMKVIRRKVGANPKIKGSIEFGFDD